MRGLVSMTLTICFLMAAATSLAQEKKQPVKTPRIVQKGPEQPQTIQIFYRIAKGARFESQDARNVSFTLKPTRAFITIIF